MFSGNSSHFRDIRLPLSKTFRRAFPSPPAAKIRSEKRIKNTFLPGGITTNLDAQVLDAEGNVIPGMYAAGECADEGTMGDAPLTVNVVFGTIAGEGAAAYIK